MASASVIVVASGQCGAVAWRALRLPAPLVLGVRALPHAHALVLTLPRTVAPRPSAAKAPSAVSADAAAVRVVSAPGVGAGVGAGGALPSCVLAVLRGEVHVDDCARVRCNDAALPLTLLGSDLALSLALAPAIPVATAPTAAATALPTPAPVPGTSDASYSAVLRAVHVEHSAAQVVLLSVVPLTVLAPPSPAAPLPRTLTLTPPWRALIAELCVRLGDGDGGGGGRGVLVAGRKDAGKSTFVRCLVNALLAASPSRPVLLLDADPGQGELHLPGLLSLHAVHAPLLASPVLRAHAAPHTTCLARVVLGATTPKHAPLTYVRAVAALAHTLHSVPAYATLPLVVNTCGWLQGRGAELLRQSMVHTRVAHVVLLHAPHLAPPALDLAHPSPQLHTLPSIALASASPSSGSAAHVRAWAWRWHVLSAPAHWVALDVLRVRGLPAAVAAAAPHEVLLALNGTVVALEADAVDKASPALLGVGLVRGVDPVLRRVLLQTPVSSTALARVHTLIATSLDLLDQERGAGRGNARGKPKRDTRRTDKNAEKGDEEGDDDDDGDDEEEGGEEEVQRVRTAPAPRRAYRSAHVLAQFSQGHARTFVERVKHLH